MPIISVEKGRLRGKRLKLPAKGVLYIGREARCQIKLGDSALSRVHCVLRGENGRWRIEDKGSSNGTFVNGAPITRHDLKGGDLMEMGGTRLLYLESAEDPLLGRTLSGCRIEERIGRGGMGTVYRAVQISLERQVAMKILAPSLAKDAAFVERFVQEARAAAHLSHPNVVQVHDAGNEGAHYYMTMEYLPGGDLDRHLIGEGRVPPSRAVHIGLDALKALKFAEARKIVHRDVKPGNLLFATDGTTKIADLGIALDLNDPLQLSSAPAAGSPPYMAPEQVRGEEIDHTADIYALGATLYHAIAGCPPYEGGTAKEVLKNKLRGDAVPLRKRAPEVPARLSAVVGTMMAHDASDRYPSASDAEKALASSLRPPRGKKTKHTSKHTSFHSNRVQTRLPVALVIATVVILGSIFIYRAVTSTQPDYSGGEVEPKKSKVEPKKPKVAPKKSKVEPKKPKVAPKKPKVPGKLAELQILIQEDRLLDAVSLLKKMPFGLRNSPEVKKQEEELEKRFSDLISVRSERIKSLCGEEDFAGARRELSALRNQVPASKSAMVEGLELYIDRAEGTGVIVAPDPPPDPDTGVTVPQEPALTEEAIMAFLSDFQLQKPLPMPGRSPVSGTVKVVPDRLEYEVAKLALEKLRQNMDTKALLAELEKYVKKYRKKLAGRPIVEVTIACNGAYGLFMEKGELRDRFVVKYGTSKAQRNVVRASHEPGYERWQIYVGKPFKNAKKGATLWLMQEPFTVTLEVGQLWKDRELAVQATGFLLSKRRLPQAPLSTGQAPKFVWEAYDEGLKRIQCYATRNIGFHSEIAKFYISERDEKRGKLPKVLNDLLNK